MFHCPIQLDVFPTDLQMRRIDPAHNMRRFYRLSVQPDLFGGATLVREWGRIGLRGQMMIELHPDEERAVTALMKLAAVKQWRLHVRNHLQPILTSSVKVGRVMWRCPARHLQAPAPPGRSGKLHSRPDTDHQVRAFGSTESLDPAGIYRYRLPDISCFPLDF